MFINKVHPHRPLNIFSPLNMCNKQCKCNSIFSTIRVIFSFLFFTESNESVNKIFKYVSNCKIIYDNFKLIYTCNFKIQLPGIFYLGIHVRLNFKIQLNLFSEVFPFSLLPGSHVQVLEDFFFRRGEGSPFPIDSFFLHKITNENKRDVLDQINV